MPVNQVGERGLLWGKAVNPTGKNCRRGKKVIIERMGETGAMKRKTSTGKTECTNK